MHTSPAECFVGKRYQMIRFSYPVEKTVGSWPFHRTEFVDSPVVGYVDVEIWEFYQKETDANLSSFRKMLLCDFVFTEERPQRIIKSRI